MPTTLDRQTYLDRIAEGKSAYEKGDPSDACPYDRRAGAEGFFGYRYWTRGWLLARSAAEEQATQSTEGSARQ
ncbi:hypothetical protein ACFCWY_09010 [Streptomyces sp. NPDC056362]|uniref:hypothetical protein n=1 Tax=unclassified Streptomyces TaxID=2593676 RepID=UPI0035DB3DFE